MTLVEFLRARLDEDEQAAQAARPGPWTAKHDWPTEGIRIEASEGLAVDLGVEGDGGVSDMPTAEHIARHDPDRVLAAVETTRQLITVYELEIERRDRAIAGSNEGNRTDALEAVNYAHGVHLLEGLLKDSAAPYADHPDYHDEWQASPLPQ